MIFSPSGPYKMIITILAAITSLSCKNAKTTDHSTGLCAKFFHWSTLTRPLNIWHWRLAVDISPIGVIVANRTTRDFIQPQSPRGGGSWDGLNRWKAMVLVIQIGKLVVNNSFGVFLMTRDVRHIMRHVNRRKLFCKMSAIESN